MDAAVLGIRIDPSGAVAGAREATAALNSVRIAAGGATDANAQMMAGINNMLAPLRQMNAILGTVGLSMTNLAGIFAGWKLGAIVSDVTQLAARIETLGVVMKAVGNSTGHMNAEMVVAAEGVRKMGITIQESQNTVVRMAQAQMDMSKASDLARVAQDAAVIGNMNSSDALNSMIHGIQSAQIEVLRTIGINVNFEQSYAKLAQQLGKSSESLSEAEKMQARLNAVVEQGKNISGAYEGALGTAGKMMSSVSRYADDTKAHIGDMFLPTYTDAVKGYYDAWKTVSGVMDRLAGDGTLTTVGAGIASIAKAMGSVAVVGAAAAISRIAVPQVQALVGGVQGGLANKAAAAGALEAAQAERVRYAALVQSIEAEIALANVQMRAQITERGRSLLLTEMVAKRGGLTAATLALAGAEGKLAAAQAASSATSLASGATGALAAAGRGLLALFGGPIGLALTAVTAGTILYATRTDEAKEATDRYRKEVDALATSHGAAATATEKVANAQARLDAIRLKTVVAKDQTSAQAVSSNLTNVSVKSMGERFAFGHDDFRDQVEAIGDQLTSGEIKIAEYQSKLAAIAEANPQFEKTILFLDEQARTWSVLNVHIDENSKAIEKSKVENAKWRIEAKNASDSASDMLKKAGLSQRGDNSVISTDWSTLTGDQAKLTEMKTKLRDMGMAGVSSLSEPFRDMEKAIQASEAAVKALTERMDPLINAAARIRTSNIGLSFRGGDKEVAAASYESLKKAGKPDSTADDVRAYMADEENMARINKLRGEITEKNTLATKESTEASQVDAEAERQRAAAVGGTSDALATLNARLEVALGVQKELGLSTLAEAQAYVALTPHVQALSAAKEKVASIKVSAGVSEQLIQIEREAQAQERLAEAAGDTDRLFKDAERSNKVWTFELKNGAAAAAIYADNLLRLDEAAEKIRDSKADRDLAISIGGNQNTANAAGKGEAAQRAAEYRNAEVLASATGYDNDVNRAAIKAVADEKAALTRITNEAVRGMELETAQINRQTDALGKGEAAAASAARADYEIAMTRKLMSDATLDATQAQAGLTAAMKAYDENAAAKLGQKDSQEAKNLDERYNKNAAIYKDEQERIVRLGETHKISAEVAERAWRDAEIKRLEVSTDAADGATRGLLKYSKDAEDMASQTERLTTKSLSGIEDAFVELQKTGELSFEKLTASIMEDITRMTIKAMILAPLAQFLASVFGTTGSGGGVGGIGGGMGGGMNINVGAGGGGASGGGMSGALGSLGGLAGGLFGLLGKGGGGGGMLGDIGSWFSDLFGGGSDLSSIGADFTGYGADAFGYGADALSMGADMGGWGEIGMALLAKGGVSVNDNIVNFAKGGAFHGPQMFHFKNGGLPAVGQLAEAGRSEAIIPLARGANGDLGVQMHGGAAGGGTQVTIEVYDQRKAGTDDIQVEQMMTQFGPVIRIIAKDEANKRVNDFAQREMPGMMKGDYGMARQPVAR